MKKKLIIMCIAAVLVAAAAIGGTLAATGGFSTQTDKTGVSEITTKELTIALDNSLSSSAMTVSPIAPGGSLTLEPALSVTNDAVDGYDLYVRVTVYKSWFDGTDKLYDMDASRIALGFAKPEDWITFYSDDEQTVLYYKHPLKQGESVDIINQVSVDKAVDNDYAGKSIALDVEADAVQVYAAEKAIKSAWGVNVAFESDGTTIKEITE